MGNQAVKHIRAKIAENMESLLAMDICDEAREAFNAELEKEDLNGLFMRDIIREEVTPDDARLR